VLAGTSAASTANTDAPLAKESLGVFGLHTQQSSRPSSRMSKKPTKPCSKPNPLRKWRLIMSPTL